MDAIFFLSNYFKRSNYVEKTDFLCDINGSGEMAFRLIGQQNSRLQEFLQDVANGRSSGRTKSLVRMQRRR